MTKLSSSMKGAVIIDIETFNIDVAGGLGVDPEGVA
jgi:hypothetical protein